MNDQSLMSVETLEWIRLGLYLIGGLLLAGLCWFGCAGFTGSAAGSKSMKRRFRNMDGVRARHHRHIQCPVNRLAARHR